jgi:hypothetical protein
LRRLSLGAALTGIAVLLAAQVTSAAPAAKIGMIYSAGGSATLQVSPTYARLAEMNVMPPGKYRVTALIRFENNTPNKDNAGPEVLDVYCSLFAYGNNDAAKVTLPAGGWTSLTLELLVDATRAVSSVYTDVECVLPLGTPAPYATAFARIYAEVVPGYQVVN